MSKKILITGAGTGIGKDAALELGRRGHTVYATCHYHEETKALSKTAEAEDLNLIPFKLDILEEKDRSLVHQYDLDVLINNAAIGLSGSAAEISVKRYREVYETNIFATVAITQEVLKGMIKRKKGRVIFITSLAGRISMPFFSPYSSSKHALEAIAASLTVELKKLKSQGVNIDVTIIEPGAYATGFNQRMIESKFGWMTQKSYFNFMLSKLRDTELKQFNKMELKTNDTVVRKYVKACELRQVKQRYVAPQIQGIAVQLMRILGK